MSGSFRLLILSMIPLMTAGMVCADVLLDGKTPVDTGHGDVIGSQARWTPCNGKRTTFAAPPYSVYKRSGDCKTLAPKDTVPPPEVFGLNCIASFSLEVGSVDKECIVVDRSLARYFFSRVERGEKIEYALHGGKLELSFGYAHLEIDTHEWRYGTANYR